jgi:hypothetical protein
MKNTKFSKVFEITGPRGSLILLFFLARNQNWRFSNSEVISKVEQAVPYNAINHQSSHMLKEVDNEASTVFFISIFCNFAV